MARRQLTINRSLPLRTRHEAEQKLTHHQMVTGGGYMEHSGPPTLPEGANGNKNCLPAVGTHDGTLHMMKPPGGGRPELMRWVAAESAWATVVNPGRGNRLAWPASYLMRVGWEYAGIAPR